MRWTEGWLCARDGWLKADPERGQTITQQISSLVLICDAKTRFHRKKGIRNVASVWNVSATGLSLYAEQRVDFIKEMVD